MIKTILRDEGNKPDSLFLFPAGSSPEDLRISPFPAGFLFLRGKNE